MHILMGARAQHAMRRCSTCASARWWATSPSTSTTANLSLPHVVRPPTSTTTTTTTTTTSTNNNNNHDNSNNDSKQT